MKKQFLILSLAIAFCLQLTAQTYKIDTSTITYDNVNRPCFTVRYDASPKTVKKAWDDYFKKTYDVKVKGIGFLTNKEVITATDITLVPVSDKRMNMYASVTEAPGDRSELSYFMSFGYDFFIGPANYPTEFTAMKKILNDFSVEFLTDFYGSEASRMTREIKDLEKSISRNNKDMKKNTKKARKESKEVASGLQAKNISMQMENDQAKLKIEQLGKDIENIKVKQAGITRN
jgi:translation elongation factor EF-1beta